MKNRLNIMRGYLSESLIDDSFKDTYNAWSSQQFFFKFTLTNIIGQ